MAGTILVLEGSWRGHCRGCLAKLWWMTSFPNRKAIPFDAEPVVVEDGGRVVEPEGFRIVAVSTEGVHWATCPKAAAFRKPKQ